MMVKQGLQWCPLIPCTVQMVPHIHRWAKKFWECKHNKANFPYMSLFQLHRSVLCFHIVLTLYLQHCTRWFTADGEIPIVLIYGQPKGSSKSLPCSVSLDMTSILSFNFCTGHGQTLKLINCHVLCKVKKKECIHNYSSHVPVQSPPPKKKEEKN